MATSVGTTRKNKTCFGTSDLNCEIFCHHAVPGCQVSVDKLLGIEVRHAVRNFCSHLDHLLQRRWWTA